MLSVFDPKDRHAKIMQDNNGNIIVFDGHHSVGYAIYENSKIPYELMPYNPRIRVTPFSVFYTNFKRLLPREY